LLTIDGIITYQQNNKELLNLAKLVLGGMLPMWTEEGLGGSWIWACCLIGLYNQLSKDLKNNNCISNFKQNHTIMVTASSDLCCGFASILNLQMKKRSTAYVSTLNHFFNKYLKLKVIRSCAMMLSLTIFLILICQSVELNPGPNEHVTAAPILILTYNCNGLGE
jgi:hypothetical protein